ncbi:MAG: outer membrane beta-barrel protein [Bryobacteraceae bacterium]
MHRWIVGTAFLVLASTASGQVGEVALSFGGFSFRDGDLGEINPGQRLELDDGFRFGARLTLNTYRFFGHEIGYAYNRSSLQFEPATPGEESLSTPIHQFGYAFLAYATPEGFRIRPFAAGGVHFSTFFPPGTSVFQGNGVTKFGLNYGGGIKAQVTPIFGIRFDVREYLTGKPFDLPNQQGKLRQLEISAGLSLLF